MTFIVQSGSMEPSISTGGVVFVEEIPAGQVDERIHEGDVITFFKSGGSATTTHRVVEKHQAGESIRFITKGDANEEPDPEPVYRDDVVGKVVFSIPYIGYVINFSGTIYGWFLLVILPVTALLMDGLWQLYKAVDPEAETEE